MNARMQKVVQEIMHEVESQVKALAELAEQVVDESGAQRLEQQLRGVGQRLISGVLQQLLQANLDERQARYYCPRCGEFWRNKGRRPRGLMSSVGAIQLQGEYRYCEHCGFGQHAVDQLASQSVTRPMRQLLCLLGAAMVSFEKGAHAAQELLGVRVSDEWIRTLCRDEGRRAQQQAPVPPQVQDGDDLVGSCDGTMVNVRDEGWKELKAYLFQCPQGDHARGYLEKAEAFAPRLRKAAIEMGASRSKRMFFVSDAAEWIDRAVEVQLPTAERIIDLWHADQHIHEAGRMIYGEGSVQAQTWSQTWSEELRLRGGREVWNRLRRVRYKDASRQAALGALLGYLDRHADRMDYPQYELHGWPISSGPMESFCKRLGRRMKGCGSRWRRDSVDPMVTLVSLWSTNQWGAYWT